MGRGRRTISGDHCPFIGPPFGPWNLSEGMHGSDCPAGYGPVQLEEGLGFGDSEVGVGLLESSQC